ncbi:MAG: MFS transporter [Candidatus Pacebacteria bacterium]|nr:MFS transporter [Candidatus Paceibacterota bacterium]
MDTIPRRSSAAILFATYICLEVVFVAATVTGPTWRNVFSLSKMELGLCLGAAQVGVLTASLFVGRITDRQGPLRMLTLSLLSMLAALGVIACGNFYMIFAGLVIAGVCAAASHNAGVTLISGVFPKNVRRVMSLASALWFGSSVVSAPLIGAWLDVARNNGWLAWGYRVPFVILAGLLLICLILVRVRLRWTVDWHRQAARTRVSENNSVAPGVRRREWLWIPLLGLCHGLMIVSLIAWLNPMAQAVFGVTDFRGSLLFGIMAFGLSTGRLLLAAYHPRLDDRLILALSGCIGASLLVLTLRAATYRMTFILVGLSALTVSTTAPCLYALIAKHFPQTRSQIYGYMEAGIGATAMAGPFIVGLLYDYGIPLRLAMGLSPVAALILGISSLVWKISDTSTQPKQ